MGVCDWTGTVRDEWREVAGDTEGCSNHRMLPGFTNTSINTGVC